MARRGPPADYLENEDLADPHPDIFYLFNHFRDIYFPGGLGGVSVEWSSSRMTMCGGTCERCLGGAIVKLSQPLLSLRPSRDLKSVLLHELIHAHCMVEKIHDPDPGGHGPPFLAIMNQINSSTAPDHERPPGGYRISTTHDWHAEVDHFRVHWWQCQRCSKVIKRAQNRKPQPADCASTRGKPGLACKDPGCPHHRHIRECGGEFIKIKEPEGFSSGGGKKSKGEKKGDAAAGGKTKEPAAGRPISSYFQGGASGVGTAAAAAAAAEVKGGGGGSSGGEERDAGGASGSCRSGARQDPSQEERRRLMEAAAMWRARAGSGFEGRESSKEGMEANGISFDAAAAAAAAPAHAGERVSGPYREKGAAGVRCPICNASLAGVDLNAHLNKCLKD